MASLFYVWEQHGSQADDGFWKFIGWISDNEALGLVERIFASNGLRTKTVHPIARPAPTTVPAPRIVSGGIVIDP